MALHDAVTDFMNLLVAAPLDFNAAFGQLEKVIDAKQADVSLDASKSGGRLVWSTIVCPSVDQQLISSPACSWSGDLLIQLIKTREWGYQSVNPKESLALIDRLLKAGHSPNAMEKDKSAISCCIALGQLDVLDCLIKAGAALQGKHEKYHQGVLLLSLKASWEEGVRELLKHDVDVNNQDNHQWNALHYAVHFKVYSVIPLLMASGVNQLQETSRKQTPLHLALANGDVEAMLALIQSGADLQSLNSQGLTLSQLAEHLEEPKKKKMQNFLHQMKVIQNERQQLSAITQNARSSPSAQGKKKTSL